MSDEDFSSIKYEHINEDEVTAGALDAQAIEQAAGYISSEFECKVITALVDAGDNNQTANLEAHQNNALVAQKAMKAFVKASSTPKKQIEDSINDVKRQFLLNAATGAEQQHAAAKAIAAVRKDAGLPYANFDSNMRNWAIRARVANEMLSKLPKPVDPEPEARTNADNPQAQASATTKKSAKRASAKR